MQAIRTVPDVNLSRLKTACSSCSLRELCLPVGLSNEEMSKLDSLVFLRRPVKRGDYLFRDKGSFGNASGVWGIMRVE